MFEDLMFKDARKNALKAHAKFGGGDEGGGGGGSPAPVAQVPQPPSYAQTVQEYVDNYPKLYNLQQEYAPKEAQMQLDLIKQYGPELANYYQQEQQRLTPYTYGLQEQLAKIASERATTGIPDYLRNTYVDQYRAEVGDNAGSPIGADYVSNNLARTAQDFNQYYQGLGLSLINKIPAQSNTAATPNISNTSAGLNGALGYAQGNYGNYVGGISAIPYTNGTYNGSGSGSGMNYGGILGSLGQLGGGFYQGYMGGR